MTEETLPPTNDRGDIIVDANGKVIGVGTRVRFPAEPRKCLKTRVYGWRDETGPALTVWTSYPPIEENFATVIRVSDWEVDADPDGTYMDNPRVHIRWDDGDEDSFATYVEYSPHSEEDFNDPWEFRADELEVM